MPRLLSDAWTLRQLTRGSAESRFHAHSYYDVPVFDAASRYVAAHRLLFQGRQPAPGDRIAIGVVDLETGGEWADIGETTAWSWQQGALSQFVPGTQILAWNIRRPDGGFGAALYDIAAGTRREISRPIYALAPDGRTALSLDMGRLNALRPGYGYAGGKGEWPRIPRDNGVLRVDLQTGEARLILSLWEAVRFLRRRLGFTAALQQRLKRYHFWFNHVKISHDGKRFTVKLRYRKPDGRWSERQGVSLTADMGGSRLGLLADATSHVIWHDTETLYFWRKDGVYLYRDGRPRGEALERLAPDLLTSNVHIRHFPDRPQTFVFDTPYREEIDLKTWSRETGKVDTLASFRNHRPARGPFRCDLHPVPSPDGRRILVTSLDDGGRQLYLLERKT